MRGVFCYRNYPDKKGNCFAVCVTNACQLQSDQDLPTDRPELHIFSKQILSGYDETKELAKALVYFGKSNYEVMIIDPSPYEGLWGADLSGTLVDVKVRNCDKEDIINLASDEFSVVFSSQGTNGKPHAILRHDDFLYDPERKESWNNPKDLDEYWRRSLEEDRGQFLLAFKKRSNQDKKS